MHILACEYTTKKTVHTPCQPLFNLSQLSMKKKGYVRPGRKEPLKKNEMDRTPAVDSKVMSDIDGTLAYTGTRLDDYEDEEYDDITQILGLVASTEQYRISLLYQGRDLQPVRTRTHNGQRCIGSHS